MAANPTTTIAKIEGNGSVTTIGGEMSVEMIVGRKRKIVEVMQGVMQPNVHYGTIPGCGPKPALFKSGAEILATTFGLAPTFTIKRTDIDLDIAPRGHREYEVTCSLRHIASGAVLGEGVGMCSTMEKKYRYRGGKENPDIADVYNTVLKMAKKRAQVDATLTAVGASDLLTQDIEEIGALGRDDDSQVADAEFRDLPRPPANLKLAIEGAKTLAELVALEQWIPQLPKEHQPLARTDYDLAKLRLTKAAEPPPETRASTADDPKAEVGDFDCRPNDRPPPESAPTKPIAARSGGKPTLDASTLADLTIALRSARTETELKAISVRIAGYEMGKSTRDTLLAIYQEQLSMIRDAAKAERDGQADLPMGGAA